MSAERSVQQGLEWLALRGLNLAALLSMERLSTDVPRLAAEADQFPTLLLIGSTGGAMWDSIGRLGYGVRPDPVDEQLLESIPLQGGTLNALWETGVVDAHDDGSPTCVQHGHACPGDR